MVVTMMWMNSWTVLIMSVSVLLVVMILLACCICWEDNDESMNQFYVLSESGLRKTNSIVSVIKLNGNQGFFRRFSASVSNFASNVSSLKDNGSASHLATKKISTSEHNLLDSTNGNNEFEHAVLQIDSPDKYQLSTPIKQQDEDVLSYLSDDSKYTFYSTYPLTRTTSVAETMRSALSQVDLDTL